jgi:predicted ATPase/class 3 adenylate cyclase/Tfp pilus assembly protein PilF
MPEFHQPPTGTVTFLFTDIEGSTKRWESYPIAMQIAFSRQESILRHAIEANGGYVYKMIGDAFQSAFPTALHALQATISAQRTLKAEQWPQDIGDLRVRMALHVGVTEERGHDYVGPVLNRVARLLSAGHGGQVLLSDPIYDLLRDILPPGVTVADMGEHRLKDLIRPEHIYQLILPDLPSEFPPLKTLDNYPNNLPVQVTSLIGRQREVATVAEMLRRTDAHLVTLTGPGGTGKTRLGLQVAAEMLEEFGDGVWYVELAPIVESYFVVSTIATAIGLREAGSTPLMQILKSYLADKHLLLMLDNFEQLTQTGAIEVVSSLVKAAPRLKVLVTSRISLQLYGEREFPVPTLELPDPKHLPSVEELTQYEAVRLFMERAQAVKPDFEINGDNARSVAEICVRLDGLPLAIELAAARIKLFPPHTLLSRLSNRLNVLTGGARDLPARQQTLRGAIEWSYDLLTEGEKQFFHRMAVFSGGRTLEALEAVCNSPGLGKDQRLQVDVFEGTASLLNNSLIQQREGLDGEPRYWMLETIQEFAREKLEESGEESDFQRLHALYFMGLAEQAEPEITGRRQAEWLNTLEDEHDNIRTALRWARQKGGEVGSEEAIHVIDVGLRMAGAIWRFWQTRGYVSEGREQLESLLSLAQNTGSFDKSKNKAKALHAAGAMAYSEGDYASARSLYTESLAIRRELADIWGIARSINSLGAAAYSQGDYPTARSLFEESLSLRRELADKGGVALALHNLGNVAYSQQDYTTARSLYQESLAILRELGDKWGIARSLNSFGIVAYSQGDYETARSFYEQSLSIRRELGDKGGIAWSLHNLGNVAYSQQDYTTARSLYQESLAMLRELGDRGGIAASLAGLGGVALGIGEKRHVRQGAMLLAAAETLLQRIGAVLAADDHAVYEGALTSARAQLDNDTLDQTWAEGQAMGAEQAVEYALKEMAD